MKWFFIIMYVSAAAPPQPSPQITGDVVGSTLMQPVLVEGAYYDFGKPVRVTNPRAYITTSRTECEDLRREMMSEDAINAMTACMEFSPVYNWIGQSPSPRP
jgi:hypothetical protein